MRKPLSRPGCVRASILQRNPSHRLVVPSCLVRTVRPVAKEVQVIFGMVVCGFQEFPIWLRTREHPPTKPKSPACCPILPGTYRSTSREGSSSDLWDGSVWLPGISDLAAYARASSNETQVTGLLSHPAWYVPFDQSRRKFK